MSFIIYQLNYRTCDRLLFACRWVKSSMTSPTNCQAPTWVVVVVVLREVCLCGKTCGRDLHIWRTTTHIHTHPLSMLCLPALRLGRKKPWWGIVKTELHTFHHIQPLLIIKSLHNRLYGIKSRSHQHQSANQHPACIDHDVLMQLMGLMLIQ